MGEMLATPKFDEEKFRKNAGLDFYVKYSGLNPDGTRYHGCKYCYSEKGEYDDEIIVNVLNSSIAADGAVYMKTILKPAKSIVFHSLDGMVEIGMNNNLIF